MADYNGDILNTGLNVLSPSRQGSIATGYGSILHSFLAGEVTNLNTQISGEGYFVGYTLQINSVIINGFQRVIYYDIPVSSSTFPSTGQRWPIGDN